MVFWERLFETRFERQEGHARPRSREFFRLPFSENLRLRQDPPLEPKFDESSFTTFHRGEATRRKEITPLSLVTRAVAFPVGILASIQGFTFAKMGLAGTLQASTTFEPAIAWIQYASPVWGLMATGLASMIVGFQLLKLSLGIKKR